MAEDLLPANYVVAKSALAECARVDECAKWAKKAMALASYAKQMRDDAMLNMAQKIRARAVERGGELLEAEKREKGRNQHSELNAPTGTKLKTAIAEAGLSPKEARTMINVARVPSELFEKMVERDKPATVKELADLGTKHRKLEPPQFRNEYIDWTRAVGQLSELPACGLDVLAAFDPYRVERLRELCAVALSNLKIWETALEKADVKKDDNAA